MTWRAKKGPRCPVDTGRCIKGSYFCLTFGLTGILNLILNQHFDISILRSFYLRSNDCNLRQLHGFRSNCAEHILKFIDDRNQAFQRHFAWILWAIFITSPLPGLRPFKMATDLTPKKYFRRGQRLKVHKKWWRFTHEGSPAIFPNDVLLVILAKIARFYPYFGHNSPPKWQTVIQEGCR